MYLVFAVIFLVLLAADQCVKTLVRLHMHVTNTIPLIRDVFHITYVQNTGAAFSIFAGRQVFLIVITAAMLLAVVVYVVKKRPASRLLMTSLTLILAGGAGNLIDRITLGYVVDFFDFCLIQFAIFNTADVFVVCGTILLAIYLLFFEKREEICKSR